MGCVFARYTVKANTNISNDHVSAVLREQPCSRRADTATAAGHDRHPVGKQCAGNRCIVHRHIFGFLGGIYQQLLKAQVR